MKKFYILCCLLALSKFIYSQSVLYGEKNTDRETAALYFDREGILYPQYFIPDTSLIRSGSTLSGWYKDHPDEFFQIAKQYGLDIREVNEATIIRLQDAVIEEFVARIHASKDSYSSVTFMVHGYRKPFRQHAKDRTSAEEFTDAAQSLLKYAKEKTRFAEIYWDGGYDCCFGSNFSKNKELFHLFETARLQALEAGCSFRKVLNKLDVAKINILSHSLGAMLVLESLFNYHDCPHATPSTPKINICLLAPSISGTDISKEYYNRNTPVDFKEHDNYRLAIAYNSQDFVLQKKVRKMGIKFGPGPYRYGITTLGCNYDKDAIRLKEYFRSHYPASYFELIDLSHAGYCHYLGDCYSRGDILEPVVRFFEE